jgi:hypothetical protein
LAAAEAAAHFNRETALMASCAKPVEAIARRRKLG